MRSLTAWTLLLFLPHFSLNGLQFQEFDPERHQVFAEGTFPNAPELNASLWAAPRNFSGVGWSAGDTRKNFALISPRHFVGANHFRPSLGSEIHFRGLDGTIRTSTYERFYPIKNEANENTDLFIGELAEPIPASHEIPFYPVYGGDESELIGQEIFVYGWGTDGPRVGRGVINGFADSFQPGSILNDTRNYSFTYRSWNAGVDDVFGEVGDSGSPSFVAIDGMLVLVGIHSTISFEHDPELGESVITYDSSVSAYRDQIEMHLASGDQRLLQTPLPATDFQVGSIELSGNEVVFLIINPAQIPYDVERTDELAAGIWETVAIAQIEPVWHGNFMENDARLFWRFRRYALPFDYPE